jgi:hypothetical protein
MNVPEVRDALGALIRGDGVGRASHSLLFEGEDLTPLFLSLLAAEGYVEARVESIGIEPGERVPAFHINGTTCHFGWVFWEVFQPGRQRKIYGSVEKNRKGDWAIMLGRSARVHANPRRKEAVDSSSPS